jgi:hypothetical protein
MIARMRELYCLNFPVWLEDYDEKYPYKFLGVKSPLGFIGAFSKMTADWLRR